VRLAIALALTVLTSLAPPLDAQRRARLELALPSRAAATQEGPVVRSPNVLADRQLRELLRNGFPARLHYRLELWSVGGMLNDLERTTDWDVIVRYDALDRTYAVARLTGGQVTVLGRFEDFADAQEAVERPFRAPVVAPRRRQGYYYSLALDVEMLSLNDLDEVERWLKGELRPAVRGERNPGTALTRGFRTLFVRLLGGERRHYEVRSGRFTPE
jgi:hypothetical protein